MSPGDEAAGKQYSGTCSEVEGGRQLETVKDLVEEVLESVILAGQRGVGVEEIIEDLIKDVGGREALDVVGNVEEMEVFETPLLHYGEEEQYLEEAMVEELAEVGSQMDVQMCSDDLTEAKGADNSQDDLNNYSKDGENNYSQDELNNSILLSEKFELSISEGFDSGGGTQASDLSDERYVKDLTEAEREVEDSVGSRALCKIDRHYYSSPRLVMRGEYLSDVINLKVKRKPVDGTYVDWFMMNKETKDIILNVKAEMTYSYDVHGVQNRAKKDGADDGASYSKRVPSGRIWYGYVSLILK